MVRGTGSWMPYPPPPNFPQPLPLACFDEMSLGSKVDRGIGYGIQVWVSSAASVANNRDGTQEALGAQSISGNLESRAQMVALGSLVCV